jgi:hypothetical protein
MIPIEFLRQFRVGGYAIFDFAAVFLGFYLLAPLLSKIFRKIRLDISRRSWLFLALPIGILTHLAFGKMTPMTRDFIDLSGHYLLKIIILILLFFGIKNIRIVKK